MQEIRWLSCAVVLFLLARMYVRTAHTFLNSEQTPVLPCCNSAVTVGLLVIPLVASFFCAVSNLTSGSRALYAFARDKAMPGHRLLASVNKRTNSPVVATWVMTLVGFLLGLPMLGSTVAFTAVTSIATIGLYLSECAA